MIQTSLILHIPPILINFTYLAWYINNYYIHFHTLELKYEKSKRPCCKINKINQDLPRSLIFSKSVEDLIYAVRLMWSFYKYIASNDDNTSKEVVWFFSDKTIFAAYKEHYLDQGNFSYLMRPQFKFIIITPLFTNKISNFPGTFSGNGGHGRQVITPDTKLLEYKNLVFCEASG